MSVRNVTLADTGILGRYYAAEPKGQPKPGVLVLGGSGGGYGNELAARLLASHGYPSLSLAYFREPGLPKELRNIPLEYFRDALVWLAKQPGVDPARIAIMGGSRGGEAALLIAATYPELAHAVVADVPSAYVNGSCCTTYSDPAWTLGDTPLAAGLNHPIAVENIAGPVLAVGAGADAVWLSWLSVKQIVQRAKLHGRTDFTGIVFPHAGHGVGVAVPNLPVATDVRFSKGWLALGGSAPADAHGRAKLWPRILRLLSSLQ